MVARKKKLLLKRGPDCCKKYSGTKTFRWAALQRQCKRLAQQPRSRCRVYLAAPPPPAPPPLPLPRWAELWSVPRYGQRFFTETFLTAEPPHLRNYSGSSIVSLEHPTWYAVRALQVPPCIPRPSGSPFISFLKSQLLSEVESSTSFSF